MGGTRKSERSQCKGSDATQCLDKNDSQILNWIIEFASSHGNHQIIKALAHSKRLPSNSSEMVKHRMHLGALKSIASNHATLATEWKVIGNLLQVIGKAISRKERQEYSVLLRDVKAYAALEAFNANGDRVQYEEVLGEIFDDEDDTERRDYFISMSGSSSAPCKPEDQWWSSFLRLIDNLETSLPQTYLSKVYRAQTARLIPKKRSAPEHREEGPPSEPVQKRMRPASDPTSSPAAGSKLQPPAARVEPTWCHGIRLKASDLRDMHPCSNTEWNSIFQQVHPAVKAFVQAYPTR